MKSQQLANQHLSQSAIKRKILISAYACEPGKGSEPGVGWNWAIQAANFGYEVHVITRSNNKTAIDAELAKNQSERPTFHYIDYGPVGIHLKKSIGNVSLLLYYYAWQILVWKKARQLHKKYKFHILHHVTFVIDWLPSGLSLIPKVPFIWGPIGGSTHIIPQEIINHLPLGDRAAERVRRSLQFAFKTFDPFLALTMSKASKILIYTREARSGIPNKYLEKTDNIIHIGVNSDDHRNQDVNSSVLTGDFEFKLLTNGRLVAWKGFDILIQAFDRFVEKTKSDSCLYITSSGPFRPSIEAVIQNCKHPHRIKLLGFLPTRDDVYKALDECDLYSLMTFRDGPPVAILEAMNAGKPILCFDMGAPTELVPDSAGYKVPFADHSYEQLINSTTNTLIRAFEDRANFTTIGKRAQEHVRSTHRWDVIGGKIDDIYASVIESN